MSNNKLNLEMPSHIVENFNFPVIMKVMKEKKYVDDFLAGKLYLNLNSFFANQENERILTDEQTDEYEGVGILLRSTNKVQYYTEVIDGKVFVGGRSVDDSSSTGIPLINASIGVKDNTANIFCMYTVWFDIVNNKMTGIDKNIKDTFGDYCVIILNFNEFLERVEKAFNDSKYVYSSQPSYGWVNYIDVSKHYNELGIFRKDRSYMYQNEFRLCMKLDRNPEPLKYFEIGDISDIALSVSTKELLSSKIKDNIWIIGKEQIILGR